MPKSDVAISVRGLHKSYTIAHNAARHSTLAEAMVDRLRHPLRRQTVETFHALRDVTFDVKRGEVIGVIGRNGAGKSTLLKILSRITRPTQGRAELYGRVGSLLEVGTGFHPELTGRENVYLNGHILGMRTKEIGRQFDAIVDFAGVEQFLDTPVKRYSSGMYVRLAFAVAAHLDAEILVVDEVLAVGDTEFQNKCLGKMKDVAMSGRTVLLVSHSIAAVQNLCRRVVLLQRGVVTHYDTADEVIAAYQSATKRDVLLQPLAERSDRSGDGRIRIVGFRLEDKSGKLVDRVVSGQEVTVVLAYQASTTIDRARVDAGISLGRGDNDLFTVLYSSFEGRLFTGLPREGELRCTIRALPFSAGSYRLGARIVADGVEADWPRDGIGEVVVEAGDFYGTGSRGAGGPAPLLLRASWRAADTGSSGAPCC